MKETEREKLIKKYLGCNTPKWVICNCLGLLAEFERRESLKSESESSVESTSESFTPTIGEIVEIIYSDDQFKVGDKVEVLECHEEEGFWVVGNEEDPSTYNESIHISNFKRIP